MASSGCNTAAPGRARRGSVYVRLDALLAVHPAWDDVRGLDTLLAHIQRLPAEPTQRSLPLPQAAFPAPLQPLAGSRAAVAPAESEIIAPALERLAGLQPLYRARNERLLEGIRRKSEAVDAAAVEAHRKSRAPAFALQEAAARQKADAALVQLTFQQIRLQSQVRVLAGATRDEYQKKLDEVNQQMAAVKPDLEAALKAIAKTFREEMDRVRDEKSAETDKAIELARARLDRQAQEQITEYQGRVTAELGALATPGASVRTRPSAVAGPNLPAPGAVAASTVPAGSAAAAVSVRGPQAALQAQRDRLVALIREDVRRRVGSVASQMNWTTTYLPGRGAPDVTDQVADLLRSQYARERSLP